MAADNHEVKMNSFFAAAPAWPPPPRSSHGGAHDEEPQKGRSRQCHCAANWTMKPEASDPNRGILSDAPVIGCLVGDHAAGSPSGTYSPGVRVAEDAMAGPPPSAQPLSAPSTGGLLPYHLQRPIRCMPSRYCGCGLPFVGAGESELDVGPPPVATNGSVLANCSW